MKEKIEEISLSMERGHRRILRVLSALLAVGLFVLLWKWRGLTAMQPLVDGGMGRWTRAVLESIVITLAAQWVLYLLPWPLLALFGSAGVAGAVRYGIMVLFAGAVWPAAFRYMARWGRKA